MKLDVFRKEHGDRSTPGKMSANGVYLCETLELPWNNGRNAHDTDCIPAGTYGLAWTFSQRHGKYMAEIQAVPNRLGIRIDIANYVEQLKGCIAVGQRSGPNEIFESQLAYDALMPMIQAALSSGQITTIEIHDPEEPK